MNRQTLGRLCEIMAAVTVVVGIVNRLVGAEPGHQASANFDTDPGWESFRSQLLPAGRPVVRQNFGYRSSNFAGGSRPGEAGGIIHRAYPRATYAKKISPKTLEDRLSASGTFAVTRAGGGSGVLVGWFNQEKSQGWRTPSSLAMRLDGNGGKYWVFCEYGTQQWGTNGVGAFEGERYQTTPTPPYLANGTVHQWEMTYDPEGADGRGLVTFRCDNQTWEFPLLDGHRQQGATFDRFGIWNQQTAGDPLEVYLDDVVIDGAGESFDTDPGWHTDGNPVTFAQRVIRPYHNFGHNMTDYAGGQQGEIGGILFRDEKPAYYADPVGPFSLEHELLASGKVMLRSAGADSAAMLGWFGADAKRYKDLPEHEQRQTDLLGIMVEGPSRIGHYFRPAYSTSKGHGEAPTHEGTEQERPRIEPNGKIHHWSLHYQPDEANGRGRITVTFDGQPHYLDLQEGLRAEGATLDRFGLFNIQSGGHHVELYVDDLRYSK